MRHPLPAALALVALVLPVLAACSSSNADAPRSVTATPTAALPTPEPTPFPLPSPPPLAAISPDLDDEATLAALRQRPLWIPALPAGAACPASMSRPLPSPYIAPAFGEGPLYLLAAPAGAAVVTVDERRAAKAVWQLAPGNEGPLLVRGRELTARVPITFDEAQTVDMVFPRGGTARGPAADVGWQDRPSLMHLPVDGCYALQLDARDFSQLIVFEARFNPSLR